MEVELRGTIAHCQGFDYPPGRLTQPYRSELQMPPIKEISGGKQFLARYFIRQQV